MPYGITPGFYDAVPTGLVEIKETKPNDDTHGLGMWMYFNVTIDGEQKEMRFWFNIMFQDQSLAERNIEKLKELFGHVGFDGNPFVFLDNGVDEKLRLCNVRVKIADKEYNGKVHSQIINVFANNGKDVSSEKKPELKQADKNTWAKKVSNAVKSIPKDEPETKSKTPSTKKPVAGDDLPF